MKDLEEKLKPIIEAKQYWKAKQILRSRIKNIDHYNPELFGLYGEILAKMHDDMEAGKYFFLSNLRGPDYDDKIELFISRYKNTKKKKYISLSCQFPKIARYRNIKDFPEPIKSDILKLDLKTDNSVIKSKTTDSQQTSKFNTIKSGIITVLVYILVIIFIVSIPIGIVTTCKWIINAIF